jgi:perosamine synthetase
MNIPFHRPYITQSEIRAVVATLKKGWITMGQRTIIFENRFQAYLGARHAVAVNSGTAALHLALAAIGLKEGDEVVLPAMTFTATGEVVRYFKAMPVLVDCDRNTHLLNAEEVAKKIGPRTRAIIPVHYGGQPCDMDELSLLAKRHRIFIVEDAAHCLPAWYKGRKIGTIGDLTCFSFYATKTLTTGEGGMVTTAKGRWADEIRTLRLHGISRDAWKRYSREGSWDYDVTRAGFKYNPTDIQCAMGIEQLKKVEALWKKRVRIAQTYAEAFRDVTELIPYEVKPDRTSAWHLFPLRLNLESLRIGRAQFIQELHKRGIGSSVHFIPLYRFTYYKKFGFCSKDYPNSEWVFERSLSLPIFPGLKKREIEYVIAQVLDIIRKNTKSPLKS